MYLSCGTRPDIAQAVNVCSRKMSAPTENDMKRVDRVIRYINAHPAHGIFYGQMDNLEFRAYVDSDWAGEMDRQSIGGLVCRLGRQGACHWKCAKQTIVAKSSSEAELIALGNPSTTHLQLAKRMVLLGPVGVSREVGTPCWNQTVGYNQFATKPPCISVFEQSGHPAVDLSRPLPTARVVELAQWLTTIGAQHGTPSVT